MVYGGWNPPVIPIPTTRTIPYVDDVPCMHAALKKKCQDLVKKIFFVFFFHPFYCIRPSVLFPSRHGGIRTHGPTLVAFEGYH